MEAAIVASTFMLGLAGAPHCTAMCAAPCAALVGRDGGAGAQVAFHLARIAGYAAAGAVAAAGVGTLGVLAALAPALRPLWVVVHAGFLALGLWLLWRGRQPAFLARFGRRGALAPAAVAGGVQPAMLQPSMAGAGWQPMSAPASAARPPGGATVRAGVAGARWFAWPCGLLQSALLVAALASTAAGGALAMAAFAAASSLGLLFAPALWSRLGRAGTGRAEQWALRAAGALMAAMSGWALTSGIWHRVAEFCATLF
ncbi:MAG: sulfite exporter TauE/SafE family protein [Rubrivivax sp.]|nr:sulfite exporter TauE/SafE family protein [Rubrivivax sp.]